MKYNHIFLLLGAVASAFTGCKDETWNYDENGSKHGVLSGRSIKYEVNAAAVVSRASSTDDFIVEITDGSEVLDRYTYSEIPNEIEMEVGNYDVVVHTPESYKAAWEKPYYEGTRSFTIKENSTTEVEKVICRLANVKVTVELSDAFRELVSDDCKLTVIANDSGELTYTLDDIDNGRAGFFEYVESSQTLVATLECTVKGEPVTFQTIYTDIQPGQHRIIYYDISTGEEPNTPVDPVDPGDDKNPGNNGDKDPDNNGDKDPDNNGDKDPDNNGDKDPDNNGDKDPDNNGDKDPDNNGDKDPDNNGDKDPDNNGDKDPDNNGDKDPDNNGDKDPDNNGDKDPDDNKIPGGSISLGNGLTIDTSITIEDLTIDFNPETDGNKPPVDLTDPDYQIPDKPTFPSDGDENNGGNGGDNSGDKDPDNNGDTDPDNNGDKDPDNSGDKDPDNNGDKDPDNNGDKDPDNNGDTDPDNNGDKDPDNNGDGDGNGDDKDPDGNGDGDGNGDDKVEAFPEPDASFDINGWNNVEEGKDYVVTLKSTHGFKNLNVEIDSETLTPDILESVGLAAEFDLAYPGGLEEGLTSLGFPTGIGVIGRNEVDFVITDFVPLLNIYGAANHIFRLTMTDTYGAIEIIEIKFKSI